MAFIDYWSELLGYVPKLSPLHAQQLINRAWREIRDNHLWTFNVAESSLVTPAAVSTGTVSVSQGSTTVLGDGAADAVWTVIGAASLVQRQFRAGNGPVYNITGYVSPNLTLDRAYGEADSSGAAYLIYQCYYDPPDPDFLRFISIIDSVNGYSFVLHKTKQELDLIDPQRGNIGQPYMLVSYRGSLSAATLGAPTFEMYPHPNEYRSYPVLYQRKGVDFALDADALPLQVSEDTLLTKAKALAYRWAMAVQTSDKIITANWMFLIKDAEAEYKKLLEDDVRQDKEAFSQLVPTYIQTQYGGINWWGNYAMSHDISGWGGY